MNMPPPRPGSFQNETNEHSSAHPEGESGRQARRGQFASPSFSILNAKEKAPPGRYRVRPPRGAGR